MPDFIINTLGEIITDGYDLIENYSDGLAKVSNYAKKEISYVDETGKVVIPPLKLDQACGFSEGFSAVKIQDTWTYINKNGEQEFGTYEFARSFKNGLGAILKNGEWNFLNREGKIVNQVGFSHCLDYHENLAVIKLNGKWGAIDTAGNLVIKNKYQLLDDFSENLARVKIKNRYGFIDKNDDFFGDPIYSSVDSFSESFAAVKLKKKWGFLSRKGLEIPYSFDSTGLFKEGHCFVRIKNNIGVIDMLGNTKIPFVLSGGLLGDCFEYSFNNGIAYANLNNQIGEISEEGFIVEKKNKSNIFSDSKTGLFDSNGRVKVSFKYNSAWKYSNGLAPVFSNKGAGYVDESGIEKIPLIYRDAMPFENRLAIVTK
jgi:hypothetical protein